MIAYVFWHRRRAEVPIENYLAALEQFHVSLREARLPGFLRTSIFQTSSVPWLSSPDVLFEDWHLLEGSAVIDPLNDAAVTGERTAPHRRIAELVDSGVAGLYRLRFGDPMSSPPTTAYWFSKPAGMAYATLFDGLSDLCRGNGTLWSRQMVLGPTPEFCLHSNRPIELPYAALRSNLTVTLDRAASEFG
jgi:hypothetical protein